MYFLTSPGRLPIAYVLCIRHHIIKMRKTRLASEACGNILTLILLGVFKGLVLSHNTYSRVSEILLVLLTSQL